MKVKVTYYESGKTFSEVVIVNSIEDAKKVGKNRFPTSKIISLNPVF
jgi:hypothetical protein